MITKIKRLFNYLFFGEVEITKEDLAYYRAHPEELNTYVNKDFVHISFLRFFFFLAIVIVFTAKSLIFYYEGIWNAFFVEVVLDVIYKSGIALLGGTITTYLLGYLRQKEFQGNIEYRNRVLDQLKEKAED